MRLGTSVWTISISHAREAGRLQSTPAPVADLGSNPPRGHSWGRRGMASTCRLEYLDGEQYYSPAGSRGKCGRQEYLACDFSIAFHVFTGAEHNALPAPPFII